MTERAQGRTRWLAAPVAGLGIAMLALLYQLVSTGALGVNFTTSDKQFKIYSNYLEGIVASGFISASSRQADIADPGGREGVAEIAVKQARLAGLCMVANETVPLIGQVGVVITGGVPVRGGFDTSAFVATDGAGDPIDVKPMGGLQGQSLVDAVEVTDLYMSLTEIDAYGHRISGLNLGESADQVADTAGTGTPAGTWPSGQEPPAAGNFGLSAEQLHLASLNGDTYGIHLSGTVLMPNVMLRPYPRLVGQADCEAQGNGAP